MSMSFHSLKFTERLHLHKSLKGLLELPQFCNIKQSFVKNEPAATADSIRPSSIRSLFLICSALAFTLNNLQIRAWCFVFIVQRVNLLMLLMAAGKLPTAKFVQTTAGIIAVEERGLITRPRGFFLIKHLTCMLRYVYVDFSILRLINHLFSVTHYLC